MGQTNKKCYTMICYFVLEGVFVEKHTKQLENEQTSEDTHEQYRNERREKHDTKKENVFSTSLIRSFYVNVL